MPICQYPNATSRVEIQLVPDGQSRESSIRGREIASFTVTESNWRWSIQSFWLASFLVTKITGDNHGLLESHPISSFTRLLTCLSRPVSRVLFLLNRCGTACIYVILYFVSCSQVPITLWKHVLVLGQLFLFLVQVNRSVSNQGLQWGSFHLS